jgi:hypothetical protein
VWEGVVWVVGEEQKVKVKTGRKVLSRVEVKIVMI